MARSIWSGVITFGMVSIPVKLYPATQDKDVAFHQLHRPDHSRIKYKKFCATEDEEVDAEDIVRAYEVSKDQYVEITDEDLEQLPLPAKHTIELSAFVTSSDIDPIYYDKSYYLEPDEAALKAYALLLKVLDQKRVIGVATIAIRNKESLCALRPLEKTLVLETLHYPDEIREREFSLSGSSVNDRELAVAETLVDALQEPFDPEKYQDHYRQALLELIESKTEGREVVAPESAPAGAPVTDLMAALRASIEAAKGRKAEAPPRKETRSNAHAPKRTAERKPPAAKAKSRKKAAA
ncbi:MAG: Ku protein [Chloroflexi bacterium]|nr:Ku protein [Chloroflexota bacterium]MBV9892994.1 Ku protein [Chloroflexota bacterium]